MIRTLTIAMFAAGLMLTAGCSTLIEREDLTDHEKLEEALNSFCKVPDTDESHVLRARLVLAATAGYALRNIEYFSSATDAKTDATAVLQRIQLTIDVIERAKANQGHAIFPTYRADNIVSLAQAAAIATQPALRAGRNVLGTPNASQLQAARAYLKAILADSLYAKSYERACSLIKPGGLADAEADANRRIELRCSQIRRAFLGADEKATTPASTLDTTALRKACGASG